MTKKEENFDDYDHLLINSPIDEEVFLRVLSALQQKDRKKNIVLTIVTYGGLPNEAFKVGRYIQTIYDDVIAFIAGECKSAGTLLASSARKIYFTSLGELGPLDVQLRKRDEIYGRRSGLNTISAIENLHKHTFSLFEHFMLEITKTSLGAVSFKTAAEISAQTASNIMSTIYGQVNMESLGQDFRDLSVATEYCRRLSEKFSNIDKKGIAKLVHSYPSHDFVIDVNEAKDIFKNVDLAPKEIYALVVKYGAKMFCPYRASDRVVEILPIPAEKRPSSDEKSTSAGQPKSDDKNTPKTSTPSSTRRTPRSTNKTNA